MAKSKEDALKALPPTPEVSMDFQSLIMTLIGAVFVIFTLPMVAMCVGPAVLWFYIDPITPIIKKLIGKYGEPLWTSLFRHKEDAFMMHILVLQGGIIPAIFFDLLYDAVQTGHVSLVAAFLYHLLRLGPYFTNFAYAYTMCHKEGHTVVGFFKPGTIANNVVFKNVWNCWIGLFYGVMPSNFAYGHSRNHHRYNNDEEDVITTWDRPRDSFMNYLRYLPRYILYALNISAIRQFYVDKDFVYIRQMFLGSIEYYVFFGIVYYLHPTFALVFLGYPLVEAILLLSAINWSWHCFLDPDTANVYAHSVTIFGGGPQTNILNEDYHVVHHQYPGAHWTTHPSMYEKHKKEYVSNVATIFNDTHAMEIFFLAILKKYDVFADKFVDVTGKMTYEDKVNLIALRLRTCSWGPLSDKKAK